MIRAEDRPIVSDPAIAARYTVEERIAAGGFARVFRGVQKTTGQPVAIKVLRLESERQPPTIEEQIERFRRETTLCARLQHPNIVPVIDSGETADGQLFAVFSFVPGWNLGDILAAEGALEPVEALHLMTQVIDALSCAHAEGIVHRDLKPGNIMVNASGVRRNAQVLDFGLGTVTAPPTHGDLRRLTLRGEYLGTPAYSAPEQLLGDVPTVRSDLYAWGLVLLECLTGEHPLGSTTPQEIIHRQLSPDPIPIPPVLEEHELGRILRATTEKDVERRDIPERELIAALHRCARGALPSREEIERSRPLAPLPSLAGGLSRAGFKLSPVWAVPLARNPNFSGRERELEQLAERVASSHLLAVVALHGMGGVGKTQLALEYAYRYADRYRLVAWIRAEERETLAADYCAIGTELHFPETPDERKRIEVVRSWLERNDGWLLVFDNAPNPEAIRAFLPRTHAGHVLVTSRQSSWRALAASLPVEVMEPDDAIEFLLARTGEEDEGVAAELAEELGRLPLALEEAAAYMEATGRSMASYLPLLRDNRPGVLLGESPTGSGTAPPPGESPTGSGSAPPPGESPAGSGGASLPAESPTPSQTAALRVTWEISFRALQEESPAASALLELCAFFAPDDLPLAMLKEGRAHLPDSLRDRVADEISRDACVAALRRYSLVQAAPDSLSFHRLVQLAARARLSEQERARWSETALRVAEEAYPHGTMSGAYKPESGRYLPHALAALSHAAPYARDPERAALLLRRTGLYRSVRGMSDLAQIDLERSLKLFETASPPDEEQIALVLWELGMVRYALGEPEPARTLLERSAGIFERLKGPSDLWVAQVLLAFAWVRHTLGDWDAVVALTTRCLAITTSILGEDNEATAMCRSVMGRALWSLGRIDEARRCAEHGMTLLSGSKLHHPFVSGTWNNLARILLDLGRPEVALDCVERCLVVGEERWGADHPFVCIGMSLKGSILLELGRLEEARGFLEKALAGGQRACRYLHGDIAIARSELAELERRLGDPDAARSQLERAVSGLARVCGDRTRVEERIHVTRAALLRDAGALAEARESAEQALALVEARLGAEHPLRVDALTLLAGTLEDLGRTEESRLRLAEARRIGENSGLPARVPAR